MSEDYDLNQLSDLQDLLLERIMTGVNAIDEAITHKINLMETEARKLRMPVQKLQWAYKAPGSEGFDESNTYVRSGNYAEYGIGLSLTDEDGAALGFELWLFNRGEQKQETWGACSEYGRREFKRHWESVVSDHGHAIAIQNGTEILFTVEQFTVEFQFVAYKEWAGRIEEFTVHVSLYDNTSR